MDTNEIQFFYFVVTSYFKQTVFELKNHLASNKLDTKAKIIGVIAKTPFSESKLLFKK